MALLSGYSHVGMVCTDLTEARRFYCDDLGFTELPRPDLGIPGMWLMVGELQLHFIEADTMPVPGPGFPHVAFHIEHADWDTTIERLRSAGVPFLGEPSQRVDFERVVRAAFISDPSGNILEITDVGPLRP